VGNTPAFIEAAAEESQDQGYYGSSSAGSFIEQVRKVVEQKTGSPSSARPRAAIHDQDRSPLMVSNEDIDQDELDAVLPRRKRADALMAEYWKSFHVLYPILDREMICTDYENLWKEDGIVSHERSLLCLLNIVFALSAQLLPSASPPERAAAAAVFHGRAKNLLRFENTTSVRYVQIYLLFGFYLQSTNDPHPAWTFVGLAVRTAQSLQLHLSTTSERISNPRHKSLLQRIWHGCVFLDRNLAMTYGRPCMISGRLSHCVPYPSPVEGESLSSDNHLSSYNRHPQNISLTDYFVSALTLYDILLDILVNFYSPDSQQLRLIDDVYEYYFELSKRPRGGFTILEIDRRLYQWKKKLPSHLHFATYDESDEAVTVTSRQAVVLRQK
jgi:hypothetical protein